MTREGSSGLAGRLQVSKEEMATNVETERALAAYGSRLRDRLSSLQVYLLVPVEPEEVEGLTGLRLIQRRAGGETFVDREVEVRRL